MRSLYLRIYLTVVLALGLFAAVSGWLVQRHLDAERVRSESQARERVEAWADLLQRSLPGPDASPAEQDTALRDWSLRLRVPMALDDANGRRIATSEAFARREAEGPQPIRRVHSIRLEDGRTLWVMRPGMRGGMGPHMGGGMGPGMMPGMAPGYAGGRPGARGPGLVDRAPLPWSAGHAWTDGIGLAALLLVLFAAVALGAWPVVRRLTRRLEALKQGVEAFGAGALHQRVAEDGRDEVAALGASFNRAAARIEELLRSHQTLLANASHELRSPLARLKMAVAMIEDTPPEQRAALRREIDVDIGELDALVEEVLLAGRLGARQGLEAPAELELLALGAEEAARVQAEAHGTPVVVRGDERLLRRALRNMLENARRYGGDPIELRVLPAGDAAAEVQVCDRGPGVPEAFRERIFEPFFRLPGHAEKAGGVGLGLSLVRQIAERHGGQVRCEPRDGGGSCFTLRLPLAGPAAAAGAASSPGSR